MLLTVANVIEGILKNSLGEILRRIQGFSEDFLRKTDGPSRMSNIQSHRKKQKSLKPHRISADKSGRRHAYAR
jgi:hypothetical protein